MNLITLLYLVSVPICAIISFGISNAYWKNEYPDTCASKSFRTFDIVSNIIIAVFFGFASVFGLVIIYFLSQRLKHGFSLKVDL